MKVWDLWTRVAPVADTFLFAALFAVSLWGERPSVREWIGMVIAFTGFAFWILARRQLGESFAIKPNAKKLVTRGLYSKFRHPIYYFELFAFFGVTLFFWNIYVTAATVFLLSVQLYRMKEENKVLRHSFGAEYERFTASVWF